MQNENPLLATIPHGERITVITRQGLRVSGTDDTTKEEAEKGLFVLYSRDNTARLHGAKQNRKTYLLAAEIIGYELEYDA